MTTAKTLCLNMIVKNETANLGRCLAALAPHIGCWVILDTGSSDGTPELITRFFAERGVPGELHHGAFVNFEQARNLALEKAYASSLDFDYLLLADADMELVVEDAAFRSRLEAPGYELIQRSGFSYWNTRLIARGAGGRYVGVTHEYLDLPGGVRQLSDAWFIDHATGSNRVDKFERDIRLLTEAAQAEPDNGRYWYYLGQTYQDAGRFAEAAEVFARRAEMGGWDEEAWRARLCLARCLRALDDDAGFVREALAAFDQRPVRAEPLYELAKFHREKGRMASAALFAEAGLDIPRPVQERLFVEDYIYQVGLKEELSIAGFYSPDPARKARGFEAGLALAFDRDTPPGARALARENLRFYAPPLAELALSYADRPVDFTPPEGWRAMNPSITRFDDRLVLNQRLVNYWIDDQGYYRLGPSGAVETRNMLLTLDEALEVTSAVEIEPPSNRPTVRYKDVLGFEDLRLFGWRGALWCASTVREMNDEGWCQQVLARIDTTAGDGRRLADWRVLAPGGPIQHEKNWMPMVAGETLRFVRLCDPTRIVDDGGATVSVSAPDFAAEGFRGGSQLVPFDGGWLAVTHEAAGSYGGKVYTHRLAWFDAKGALAAASRPFILRQRGIEFVAGLSWMGDGRRLVISFGVNDAESWLAVIEADDARAMLGRTGPVDG